MAQETCPLCCRPLSSPFRVYNDRGKVTAGCVDDSHTGHLTPISESASWHSRPEAKRLRRKALHKLPTGRGINREEIRA